MQGLTSLTSGRVWRGSPSAATAIVQSYHNNARTYLSLDKDAPVPRKVQSVGRIFAKAHLGGLHHEYGRIQFTVCATLSREFGEQRLHPPLLLEGLQAP